MTEDPYSQLCSYGNLYLAFKNARKGKTLKPYVVEFDHRFKDNLLQLRTELLFHSYKPKPLQTLFFVIQKLERLANLIFGTE